MEQKIEIWRDIPGYEGSYQVSNRGRVKSLLRNRIRILKPRKRSRGMKYLNVALFTNGKRKEESIHRLVALAFLPNPNNYPVINHKDENPGNNHVDNLEWCTVEYNYKYSEKTRLKNLRKAVREKESWRKGIIKAQKISKEKKTWIKAMEICHERQTWKKGLAKAHEKQTWKKANESRRIGVIQMDINGKEIGRFASIKEASELIGIALTCICACCHGRRKTAGGYKWQFIK